MLPLNRAHVCHWCQLKVENQCWQGFKLCLSTSRHFPPHPLTPSPTVGRRGIGFSYSPLPCKKSEASLVIPPRRGERGGLGELTGVGFLFKGGDKTRGQGRKEDKGEKPYRIRFGQTNF
ncbi:hypothetical protein MC7420_3320 [Coleofasciculus chthonoplastes PCC 7420]|uniref:Uncharacterized protein n=1 Tax=Coleofasciculus chthonoplastes PCC 7420 TaxID=118168 RepID=B4VYV5_9CYAN|nr:hypothetical protein MC7420_3320 [Coleofasciculus chthonoplastes PCC 7420]